MTEDGGGQGLWEISVLSAQLCCDPKTAFLKSAFKICKFYLIKKGTVKNYPHRCHVVKF